MNQLSSIQIDLIRADIRQNGIELMELEEDLLDHICCAMENEGSQGRSFEDMYHSIRKEIFPEGYRRIQETTLFLLTQKFNKMKKLMNASGIAGSALLLIGSMAKALHLPGAAVGLVVGAGLIILLYFPLMLMFSLKQTDLLLGKFRNFSGYVGANLIIIGMLMQILHWPYGEIILSLGIFVFIIVFVPLFLKSVGNESILKIQPVTVSVILIAIISSLFAFSNKRPSIAYINGLLQVSDDIEQTYLMKKKMLSAVVTEFTEIDQFAEQALVYIEDMKGYIIDKVDPESPTGALNIYNIFYIMPELDEVFLETKDEFHGRELYQRVAAFVTAAKKINPSLQTTLWNGEDESSWLESHFETKPLYSIYTSLSNYQLEIANLELEVALDSK